MPLLAVHCPIPDMLEFTTHKLLFKAFLLGTVACDVGTLSQCMTCVTVPVMMLRAQSSIWPEAVRTKHQANLPWQTTVMTLTS